MKSMEDGLGYQKRNPNYIKRLKKFVFNGIKSILYYILCLAIVVLVALCLIELLRRARMIYITDKIIKQGITNRTCTTPRHLQYEWYNVVYVNNTSLFWPKVLQGTGEVNEIWERSRLCDQNTEPILSQRHENVYISYYKTPFDIFPSKMLFIEEQSICVQHMIDYLKGLLVCGKPKIFQSKKDEL